MLMIVLVGLMQVAAHDFGAAPQDTLKPIESINRLADIFKNCEFSAVQTRKSIQPSGGAFTKIIDMRCKVCKDAIVIKNKIQLKDQVDVDGKRLKDNVSYTERRWIRENLGMVFKLSVSEKVPWPPDMYTKGTAKIAWINVIANKDQNKYLVWETEPVGDFLGELDLASGITFADMVTNGGRRGYSLQNVRWTTADRSTNIAYQFTSTDYGTTTVSFTKVDGQWMPSLINIVRLAENKVFADDPPGSQNRVKNYMTFYDFKPPAPGLDRYETVFAISYGPLPVSIERKDTYFYKGEQSTTNTKLVFNNLRSGGVSFEEVKEAMLPIPDGCKVHPLEDEDQKLAWTTKNGAVIKSIDSKGLDIGRKATFSSTRRVGLLLMSIILAVLVAIFLYRHRRLFIARGVE